MGLSGPSVDGGRPACSVLTTRTSSYRWPPTRPTEVGQHTLAGHPHSTRLFDTAGDQSPTEPLLFLATPTAYFAGDADLLGCPARSSPSSATTCLTSAPAQPSAAPTALSVHLRTHTPTDPGRPGEPMRSSRTRNPQPGRANSTGRSVQAPGRLQFPAGARVSVMPLRTAADPPWAQPSSTVPRSSDSCERPAALPAWALGPPT